MQGVYLQVISRTGSKGTGDAAEQELRLRRTNEPELVLRFGKLKNNWGSCSLKTADSAAGLVGSASD